MRALAVLTLALCACSGPDRGKVVQPSAPGNAIISVSLNRILSGRYRAIAPACIGYRYLISATDVVPTTGFPLRPGHVVEFRNFLPSAPSNVTGASLPEGVAMFSPNLVFPYNYQPNDGEPYSYWRYALPAAGIYEYFDTNMGEPGRKVVDSYYGTVSYIGESNAPKGWLCADAPGCVASRACLDGSAPAGTACCLCPSVCCDSDQNCTADKTCVRGRCLDKETGE